LANIKQQKKRILVAQRQRLENLRYRSSIKTYFRRLETRIDEGDAAAVTAEHRELVRLIDKAAAKRALHPNTAARKKARAERAVARGSQVVEQPKRKAAAKPAARKRTTTKKK
jgi:small subunit ribosomal protein S20